MPPTAIPGISGKVMSDHSKRFMLNCTLVQNWRYNALPMSARKRDPITRLLRARHRLPRKTPKNPTAIEPAPGDNGGTKVKLATEAKNATDRATTKRPTRFGRLDAVMSVNTANDRTQ